MNFLKKFYRLERRLLDKPNVILPVWIAFGFIIGIGIDNIGAGVAIGVAIGVAFYTTRKKQNPESSSDDETGI